MPAALAFAHLALAAAEILALAAALILRFFGCDGSAFCPLAFAHLAFWAAAILALPAALILRLDFGAATGAAGLFEEPKILCSLFWSDWILSLMLAARLNCLAERFAIGELIGCSIRSFGLKSQQSLAGVHF